MDATPVTVTKVYLGRNTSNKGVSRTQHQVTKVYLGPQVLEAFLRWMDPNQGVREMSDGKGKPMTDKQKTGREIVDEEVRRAAKAAKDTEEPEWITTGERNLIDWSEGREGCFVNLLFKMISIADVVNIEKLRKAYPQEVGAYVKFHSVPGYFIDLIRRHEKLTGEKLTRGA